MYYKVSWWSDLVAKLEPMVVLRFLGTICLVELVTQNAVFRTLHGSNLSGVSHPQNLQTVQLFKTERNRLYYSLDIFAQIFITKSYCVI